MKVTAWSKEEGLALEATLVAVGAAFTVSRMAEEVEEVKFVSPL